MSSKTKGTLSVYVILLYTIILMSSLTSVFGVGLGGLLPTMVCLPLAGAVMAMLMPSDTELGVTRIKLMCLATSLLTLLVAVVAWVCFDDGHVGYQYVCLASAGFAHVHLGIDSVALYFILLTTVLTPICLLASWHNVAHRVHLYFALQLIVAAILTSVFVMLDMLLFYVAFETVLMPLFVIVGMWGGSPTRVRSALLLFLYTLAGSLFMLLSIMAMYAHTGTTDMTVLANIDIAPEVQRVLWLGFAVALAVKTPLVPFHVWLPRAHADAPLAGSMVLAGTVLKLATYGIIRVMLPILPDACAYYAPLVSTLAVVSLVYSSLATLRQVDLKALVAYSSVAHMAVVVLGLFSNTTVGIEGAVMLSLAHGFVSPALFMIVGGVLYDRFHTRAIRYYRGLAVYMPVMSSVYFVMTLANMGTPLTLNWAGEFMALAGVFVASPVTGAAAALGILLSSCYSIWLWGRMVAGAYSTHLTYTTDINRRELSILMPLTLLTLVFGVVPSVLLSSLHGAVTGLLYIT